VRRGSFIQLVVIGALASAVAVALALLVPWLPPAAGEEAVRIHFVFWFTTVICIGVFGVVAGVLGYCIWKFRAKPDDDSDGPPTHGHTKLEIWWTAVPAVLVTAISIVSAIVLAQNSDAGSNPLRIKVTAQQFAWAFTYPNGKSFGSLTLPKDRHTRLDITSNDVIHSFWVPELSQKQDAVTGQHNSIVVTPTRTGTFAVICTELCGLGHALMRSHVDVLEAAKFDAWLKGGGKEAGGGGGGSAGLAVFNENGCGSCHTFKPAGSNGNVGPDLDNLAAYAKQANRGSVEEFTRESIVEPGAYIQPKYPDAMPHIYGERIQGEKLDQLVQYLVQGAK
jgi:cytochrome c oxidase subunit II